MIDLVEELSNLDEAVFRRKIKTEWILKLRILYP